MGIKVKSLIIAALAVFLISTAFFSKTEATFGINDIIPNEEKLGMICIKSVLTAAELNIEAEPIEEKEMPKITDPADNDKVVEISEKPQVIIYHTHSSESYMPYKEGNYHREEEAGTVREVGDVLEEELEKMGINVIHDKTVHDRPSYNESYERSLSTIKVLSEKYPTAEYIIDLHRDAAPASVNEGKYTTIDDKRVATFSLVVGGANENYVELYDFAEEICEEAGNISEGFSGKIIEKDYNYNQFVSNKALLLEVGNNKNTIEEANECARYFAQVIGGVIRGNQ